MDSALHGLLNLHDLHIRHALLRLRIQRHQYHPYAERMAEHPKPANSHDSCHEHCRSDPSLQPRIRTTGGNSTRPIPAIDGTTRIFI